MVFGLVHVSEFDDGKWVEGFMSGKVFKDGGGTEEGYLCDEEAMLALTVASAGFRIAAKLDSPFAANTAGGMA